MRNGSNLPKARFLGPGSLKKVFLSGLLCGGLLGSAHGSGSPFFSTSETVHFGIQETQDLDLESLDLSPEVLERLSDAVSPSLSSYFIRATQILNNRPLLELIHLRVGFDFALLATEIDPNNSDAWRLLLEISNISDPDDPEVRDAIQRSLTEITRLDPTDKVILLRRLLTLVELNQTAAEKVAAFEKLLTPRSIEILGTKTASRLAFSLAQLQSRIGDSEGFARHLAQAVELDPYYPAATAMAAGYFAIPDDPHSEVELLIAALIANPLDVGFASRLGAIALDVGAYSSAARMLSIAQSSARSAGSEPLDLVLDNAIALWGANRSEEAQRILDVQQRNLDTEAQRQAFAADDSLTADDLAKIKGPTPPLMALLWAAILSEGTDEMAYRFYVNETLTDLILMLDEELELDVELGPEAQAQAVSTLLEAAAFAAWQGEDSAVIELLVSEAQSRLELSEATRARFDIWQDIVDGRYSIALEALSEISDDDHLTVLTRSIAYERTGQMQDAARTWLQLVRSTPGSIIGIWSKHKLEAVLGKEVGQTTEASKIQQQVKSIPITVDRMLLDRERAYSFRLEPVKTSVPPFSAIDYSLKITNNSGIPLSIGPLNPIHSSVALLPKVTSFGSRTAPPSKFVTQIDRKLSINPRETLEVIVNLGNYPSTRQSFRSAFNSATYELRGITNFLSDGVAVAPGRFGEKASSLLVRVDGVSNDPPWRRDAFDSARSMNSLASVHNLSLLLQMAAQIPDENEALVPIREDVFALFEYFYPRMPAKLRAWFAATSPEVSITDGYSDIESLFYLDDHPLVISAMLVKLVWGLSSEISAKSYLDWASNSINSEVSALARQLQRISAQDMQYQGESLLGDQLGQE